MYMSIRIITSSKKQYEKQGTNNTTHIKNYLITFGVRSPPVLSLMLS